MKKYKVGLVIVFVLFLIVYPFTGNRFNLGGNWTIKHLIINGEDLLQTNKGGGRVMINPINSFTINGGGHFKIESFNLLDVYDHGLIRGRINIVEDDTLIITSSTRGVLDAKYYLEIDTILNKKLLPPEIDVKVRLTSKNKEIQFVKHELVGERNRWLRTIPRRGRGAP